MESRIKQLREKRGLIQEILAAELGITQQMLSKYEKLNLVRSTIHEHRTRSLEILKIMLEENAGENGRKKRK